MGVGEWRVGGWGLEGDRGLGLGIGGREVGVGRLSTVCVCFISSFFTFQLLDKPWSHVLSLLAPPVRVFHSYRE